MVSEAIKYDSENSRFRANWISKMAALASDLLIPLDGIQGNLRGSNISTSSTKSVWFSDKSEKKNRNPGSFSTFPLTPQNGIHHDRKQDLKVLYEPLRPISIQKWPPWPIHLKGCTLYSGARNVAIWSSCFVFLIINVKQTNADGSQFIVRNSVPFSQFKFHRSRCIHIVKSTVRRIFFLNTCMAVSEDNRKWALAWQSQSGIYITIQYHTQLCVVCL